MIIFTFKHYTRGEFILICSLIVYTWYSLKRLGFTKKRFISTVASYILKFLVLYFIKVSWQKINRVFLKLTVNCLTTRTFYCEHLLYNCQANKI